jgi:4-hydroxy-3-polyprenylbenzoate decarboxylase
VTDRVCKTPNGVPALLFEQPTGYGMPVATNLYGSTTRMCLALGVNTPDDLAKEIDELMTPQMPGHHGCAEDAADGRTAARSDAEDGEGRGVPGDRHPRRNPRQPPDPEVLARGWRQIHHVPAGVHQDPESGVRNIGTYRMQVFDARTTGMHWQRHKGGAQHYRVAERLGKRLEVAVALGAEPVLPHARPRRCLRARRTAARRLPLAQADRDGQVRDRRSRGAGQLHIVLEGYVEPGERRREGRSAITPASIPSPTIFRSSTSPASRNASGRPT